MRAFDWLSKITPSRLETKSNNIYRAPVDLAFADFLIRNNQFDLSFAHQIELYSTVMPFFNPVDIRAEKVADTPIRLFDESAEKFIPEHDILKLLANPNDMMTGPDFMYAMASFYDITGNVGILSTGDVTKPPIEMAIISPSRMIASGVDLMAGLVSNVPTQISLTSDGMTNIIFKPEATPEGIRFYNADRDKELWVTRSFNPRMNTRTFFGMSRAMPLMFELEQFNEGSINNLANLKNGSRLSMVWQNNRGEPMTDDQWSRMTEMAQKYMGSQNAGGTPVLDGVEAKSIASNNREMEFQQLQADMFARCHVIYDVPLSMVTNEASTFDNVKSGQLSLWDNATGPLNNRLHASLTRFLMPRYGETDLKLTMNPHDIPALRLRTIEEAEKQNMINVNTVDEIRELLGDEPIASGVGADIYAPATLVPLGSAATLGAVDDAQAAGNLKAFLALRRNDDGSARYTEAEIKSIVEVEMAKPLH